MKQAGVSHCTRPWHGDHCGNTGEWDSLAWERDPGGAILRGQSPEEEGPGYKGRGVTGKGGHTLLPFSLILSY